MPLEVAILVGLPASGKSSFYRARLAATHAHVSKDLMASARRRDERQRREIAAALVTKRSVCVDNTNATREARAELIALGRAHGARVVCYDLGADVAACLARNRRREGKARVPDVAVYTIARRMELPSPDEGFDALLRVRLVEPDGFEVTPA